MIGNKKEFERYKVLQGSQTCLPVCHKSSLFERYKVLQGSQTMIFAVLQIKRFERYKVLQGSQTYGAVTTAPTSLRDIRFYKALKRKTVQELEFCRLRDIRFYKALKPHL